MYGNIQPGDQVWTKSAPEKDMASLTGPWIVESIVSTQNRENPEVTTSYMLVNKHGVTATVMHQQIVRDRYTDLREAAADLYNETRPPEVAESATEPEPAAAAVS